MKNPILKLTALMILVSLFVWPLVSCNEIQSTSQKQQQFSIDNGMLIFSKAEDYSGTFNRLLEMDYRQIVNWEKSIGFDNSLRKYNERISDKNKEEINQDDEFEGFTIPVELQAIVNKDGLVKVGKVYYLYVQAYEFEIPEDKVAYAEDLKKNTYLKIEGITKRLLRPERTEVVDFFGDPFFGEIHSTNLCTETTYPMSSTFPDTCSQSKCCFSYITPGILSLPRLQTDKYYLLKYRPYPCSNCELSFYVEFFSTSFNALGHYYVIRMRGRKGTPKSKNDKMWASKLDVDMYFNDSICSNFTDIKIFDVASIYDEDDETLDDSYTEVGQCTNSVSVKFDPIRTRFVSGIINYEYSSYWHPIVYGKIILN